MREDALHGTTMRLVRRLWPFGLILAGIAGAWASGLTQQLSWAALGRNEAALSGWIGWHPIAAPSAYVLFYALTVVLVLPESAVLTVAGGLLFGVVLGGCLALAGSSLGAVLLFLAIRYHLADAIAARRGRLVNRIRSGLVQDGFLYLLAIRLIPAFPFWLVNLAGSLSGMRLPPYAAATVIGSAPATFIFASIGAGIAEVLAAGGRPDLAIIFSPRILGPLIGLAVLSLLPIAWRKWKGANA